MKREDFYAGIIVALLVVIATVGGMAFSQTRATHRPIDDPYVEPVRPTRSSRFAVVCPVCRSSFTVAPYDTGATGAIGKSVTK